MTTLEMSILSLVLTYIFACVTVLFVADHSKINGTTTLKGLYDFWSFGHQLDAGIQDELKAQG